MKARLCNSSIVLVFQLLRLKKQHQLKVEDVEELMKHEDYQFEFRRYDKRIQ